MLTDFGDQLPAQAVEHLQQVMQSTARMNRLVQDLLDYSRLTRIEMSSAPVKVLAAVDEAVRSSMKNRAKE